MAKLTMMRGQMVLTASTKAEQEELETLAYNGSNVTVEKPAAKKAAKKADD